MINTIHTAYADYTKTHGTEPSVLRVSQNIYTLIYPELHCDWNGADMRFLNAEVIIPDNFDGFEFSNL